jgi:hypothetical protein
MLWLWLDDATASSGAPPHGSSAVRAGGSVWGAAAVLGSPASPSGCSSPRRPLATGGEALRDSLVVAGGMIGVCTTMVMMVGVWW